MKTLQGHLFLYDKDCPLCSTYTRWFLTCKLLDAQSRVAFQDINQMDYPNVDFELAQNKVALVDTTSGAVCYGIDAMNKVLGIRFPFISWCLKFKPLYWFMTQVYAFISFNRKVFIPVSCSHLLSCNPHRTWKWRILFVVVFLLLANGLFGFGSQAQQSFWINSFIGFLLIQALLQWLMIRLLHERNSYDYIGHVAITYFQGSLFAWCMFNLAFILFPSASSLRIIHIMLLVIITFYLCYEHQRRIRIAEINPRLGITFSISFILFILIIKTL